MTAKKASKWVAIRRRGVVVAWMEVFYCRSSDSYVSIPGISGWRNA